ncbi:flagellar basal-body rod protein FlgB [Gracilibacillus ureilyticus]|uniref:Flagellar basal body rod protein FlgB n=1 Tax=Gracilibacillus ureilyticus TaxID=531814 RepID=A0A1H9L4Z8_9BACI|nr:flagellar basal body rod protein FlgB [Gracilibacillus ureilyticus]SER06217.1 flagellar basal-body rod protein FlgB [Gracilibacillus ureilyticus]
MMFGNTIQTLERSLNYSSVKNQTIANNISNVDTANYKAKQVVFKNVLDNELGNQFEAKRTNSRHIDFGSNSGAPYKIMTNQSTTYNHNGNNVDIDKEMSELAKNQIYYQAVVDRLNGKFNSLQSVIRGGN